MKLGEILLERKLINLQELTDVLSVQQNGANSTRLGCLLLQKGYLDDQEVLINLIAQQLNVNPADMSSLQNESSLANIFPVDYAIHFEAFPLAFKSDCLHVALADPSDMANIDLLQLLTGYPIKPFFAMEHDILESTRRFYGLGADILKGLSDEADSRWNVGQVNDYKIDDDHIGRFLLCVLKESLIQRATDIHIEPQQHRTRVRFRIDGLLYDIPVPNNITIFYQPLSAKIKVLSGLSISERRRPQDGRFQIKMEQRDYDIRASFLPTPTGESIVLRVLDNQSYCDLESLGLLDHQRISLKEMMGRSHGIVFVTGPTGSGKTTSLYACLRELNTMHRKILTIEDPIEYQLNGATQIQVNPSVGLDFSKALRSALRHDPDIMMIGEVRDQETAQIATRVALTGHLIFSTLHTNDAASGIARLIDMGIDSYLITSTVVAFIAQRLIRKVCPHCKVASSFDHTKIDSRFRMNISPQTQIYQAKGCSYCFHTGFRGREAIYEFLILNDQIKTAIDQKKTSMDIKHLAVSQGMSTLAESGWKKVLMGRTTPEELLRVVGSDSGLDV